MIPSSGDRQGGRLGNHQSGTTLLMVLNEHQVALSTTTMVPTRAGCLMECASVMVHFSRYLRPV